MFERSRGPPQHIGAMSQEYLIGYRNRKLAWVGADGVLKQPGSSGLA